MNSKEKLGHPVFILLLFVLILNDWYLKPTFSNYLTGKISDFAGVFIFPFFLSSLFPKHRLQVYIGTGVLFIIWKTEFIQPVIDTINSYKIPIHRTVDYSDFIALSTLPVSYLIFSGSKKYELGAFSLKTILFISSFAFIATSMPPRILRTYSEINKTYYFNFSKRELVSRLNELQLNEIKKQMHYMDIDFNSEFDIFYQGGSLDTLAIILDYQKIREEDTIRYKSALAEIMIWGTYEKSSLRLVRVSKVIPMFRDKDYREKTIKIFEKKVIKKIKRGN